MSDIPYGYCQCGCGQKTTLSPSSRTKRHYVKGQPQKFINGHWRRSSSETRFWLMTDKRGVDECWEWQGSRDNKGYGHIRHNGKVIPATHVAWFIAHGELPKFPLLACHTCDNPPCVNEAHLFLGTNQENMDDAKTKNRFHHSSGSKNGWATLTESDVIEMRRLHTLGVDCPALGKMFKTSRNNAWRIVNRKGWKHLP